MKIIAVKRVDLGKRRPNSTRTMLRNRETLPYMEIENNEPIRL